MLFLDYTPDLNSLEFDIYHYISNNMNAVIYMRIRELSLNTHTSTASILRFCKKFECSGFTEFKIRLHLYLETAPTKKVSDVDESEFIHFLERINQPLLSNRLTAAVEALLEKRLVLFLGSGSSEAIAEYGALYFTNLSQNALKISDPSNYSINNFPDDILEKTCVIVLSVTGETQEIINFLETLNKKSCFIISITNSDNSTISSLSNINIPYFINRETIHKQTPHPNKTIELTSQLPALFIIEKLAKKMYAQRENILR